MKKQITLFVFTLLIAFSAVAQEGYQIGDKATDFNLKGTDGKMYSFEDFGDVKGYVIIFTCNHCPFSVAYEDRIIALQKDYYSKGFPVIAINPNDPDVNPGDSFEKMIVRAKEKAFNFPYLFDEGQRIYPQYGATKTPHVFLLDSEKIVRYIGAIDDSTEEENVEVKFLENAIIAMAKGERINPEVTKAIGCSIKVKK